ncbi:hypothetical protein BVRB_027220 [Beta vulgaris subsp. vulgaris]|uniref:Uncharacterized protein n=1 Tax=Beta vulgaris subsp. vulgaris TaxID=3555 RepID=A0A0J8B1T5_BETVV|nr:hypothetical protein BVRB_027220 [Beta vulgaris subsp. vulgaris]
MADVGSLDEVVIRVPASAARDKRTLLKFVSESFHVKLDVIIVILSAVIAVLWRHRVANAGMLAVLDILFGLSDWTALFASLTFLPCILMMQAIRSIKFQLYLAAIAILASIQIVKKHYGTPFVPSRNRNTRLAVSGVWAWVSVFTLLESIKTGLESQPVFLTTSLCSLALLASVKSLLRSRPASDYSSIENIDNPQ